MKPALLLVTLYKGVEPRFVNWEDVLLEPVNLVLIDVRAGNIVPRLGQAGTDDEPYVSGSDNRDLHTCSDSLMLMGRNSLPMPDRLPHPLEPVRRWRWTRTDLAGPTGYSVSLCATQ